jgi:pimeloyl-ACP methyl ester carboxylesterase
MPQAQPPYTPRRAARRRELAGREGRIAVTQWGPPGDPPIVLLHGWMDCGAAWQLLVDCLPEDWPLLAIDWPGYGCSARRADRYWFADHLAELDWLLDELAPHRRVRLIGHSMGGTIASMYAGIRPQRLQWLVNIEGFGMPALPPVQLPDLIAGWLDALRTPPLPRQYASLDELAAILQRGNPRLPFAHAHFLARVWTREADGGYAILADPRQQLPAPSRFARAELEACWARVSVPLLLLYGSESAYLQRALGADGLARLRQLMPTLQAESIAGAGHLLPHEQPQPVAQAIIAFAAAQS